MVSGGSLRWAFFLLFLLVVIGQLSEGKRGGGSGRGGGRSGGRGSSRARSSSKSSGSWFTKSSKSSGGKSWYSSSTSSSRSGGGFKSSGGRSWPWTSANPRPSVSRDSVSRGIYSSSPSIGYYGSSYGSYNGCGFGGCGNNYIVYHYYPRSYYYGTRRAATTPSPIGPNASQVSGALSDDYDTQIVNGTDTGSSTDVMEIADPTRPLVIQDLAFFWDSKYLPSEDTKGCASYIPANANSSISFCDVSEYSRCKRDIKELPSYQPDSLFFADGTSPSHLAWMCPVDTYCCEWECCHDDGWSFGEKTCIAVVACALFYYICKCCLACTADWREEMKWNTEAERLEKEKLNGVKV